jgi:hypothetical protein
MDVRSILEELGYNLSFDGEFFRTSALYRNGDNRTAIRINRNTGRFVDFVGNIKGGLETLVKLTLNLSNVYEAEEWLQGKKFTIEREFTKPRIDMPEYYPEAILKRLMPAYDFYLKKGISEATIRKFKGGIAMSGKMNNRFVFPLYDEVNRIVGFAGRDILGTRQPKWKIIGQKKLAAHPYSLIKGEIKKDTPLVIVEGIGDVLALYDCGILSFPTFGLKISQSLLKLFVIINPYKIVVATNNEPDNESRGNQAAVEIETQLLQIFDRKQVLLKLPPKKDFGVMDREEITDWKQNLC